MVWMKKILKTLWIVHCFLIEVPSGNEEVKSKGVRKGEAERRGEGEETGETPLANGRLQLSFLAGTDPPGRSVVSLGI